MPRAHWSVNPLIVNTRTGRCWKQIVVEDGEEVNSDWSNANLCKWTFEPVEHTGFTISSITRTHGRSPAMFTKSFSGTVVKKKLAVSRCFPLHTETQLKSGLADAPCRTFHCACDRLFSLPFPSLPHYERGSKCAFKLIVAWWKEVLQEL